ncbi:MAG: hypothetical protein COU85_01500 [Candidatus Portnoybacteria bacterium CG10_big_fil_rev_8_21_14_0_10_44_7]|uniref:Uncharacterized protein n=1 Tax=Candidatus Portnoybacteria bacterium CG10_big_fil_rev_8_21_14_0_10_44_7 TaxID=1974816 RepID=A0A2M8KIW9_9BACT|nr:MAG: hypothetical protein COU85_01500 [Candidatus Portnoybacteria bacterium CG10_big_fil_rev_8_21_14_0_10_44_7]
MMPFINLDPIVKTAAGQETAKIVKITSPVLLEEIDFFKSLFYAWKRLFVPVYIGIEFVQADNPDYLFLMWRVDLELFGTFVFKIKIADKDYLLIPENEVCLVSAEAFPSHGQEVPAGGEIRIASRIHRLLLGFLRKIFEQQKQEAIKRLAAITEITSHVEPKPTEVRLL